MSRYYKLTILLFFLCFTCLITAKEKEFSVPLNDLEQWSKSITITFDDMLIIGHSPVHNIASDCEMHFAASTEEYKGDPPGIVLEPMNVCLERFFGSIGYKKAQWVSYANGLLKKHVKISGVPRLWPEHLLGNETKSNPHHALEIHPLTNVELGSQKYDFTKFIYAPEGFDGGLSDETARKILEKTEVSAERDGSNVNIDFTSGQIGNFVVLEVQVNVKSIKEMKGGHAADGKVDIGGNKQVTVHLVTVKGTVIDAGFEKMKSGSKQTKTLDLLILFSLYPASLYDAAKMSSGGQQVKAVNPLQLIVYGAKKIS